MTKKDWQENKDFDACLQKYDTMLVQTDTSNAPWTVVEAMDKKYALCKIMTTIVRRLEMAVKAREEKASSSGAGSIDMLEEDLRSGVLRGVDLSLTLEPEMYKKKRKDLQKRLAALHNKMYLERVPVVLAFEGWDAAGKGGAIKRLTQCIDPRGYEVIPIASPNDVEKSHHYLWRFWQKFPKRGHLAIFDRTWYGRVLV